MKMYIYLDNFLPNRKTGGITNHPISIRVDVIDTDCDETHDFLITADARYKRSMNYHPKSPYGWEKVA